MAHAWESPEHCTREVLIETLEERIPDLKERCEIIDLALEEFDCQFAEADDEMVAAGLLCLNTHLEIPAGSTMAKITEYRRRRAVEEVWRVMAEKAFGR